jgi:hypothetical protein
MRLFFTVYFVELGCQKCYRLKLLFLKVELLFYYLCRAGLSGFNFNPLYDAGNIEFSFCYPGILIKIFY